MHKIRDGRYEDDNDNMPKRTELDRTQVVQNVSCGCSWCCGSSQRDTHRRQTVGRCRKRDRRARQPRQRRPLLPLPHSHRHDQGRTFPCRCALFASSDGPLPLAQDDECCLGTAPDGELAQWRVRSSAQRSGR